jgi:hypothetical protein
MGTLALRVYPLFQNKWLTGFRIACALGVVSTVAIIIRQEVVLVKYLLIVKPSGAIGQFGDDIIRTHVDVPL